MILNYLIAFAISFFGSVEKKPDGWFAVDQPVETSLSEQLADPGFGVVFFKRFGEERVFIRFPGEPVYSRSGFGSMKVSSEDGLLSLQIQKKEAGSFEKRVQQIVSIPGAALRSLDQKRGEIVYELQGKWIRERFVSGEERDYLLLASSDSLDDEKSSEFLNSFSLRNKF